MASSVAARGGAGSVRNNGPPPPPPGRPPLPSQADAGTCCGLVASSLQCLWATGTCRWSCGWFLEKVLRWMPLPMAIECCHECFFYRVFCRRLHRRNMHGGILSPFTGNGRVAKVCAMRYVWNPASCFGWKHSFGAICKEPWSFGMAQWSFCRCRFNWVWLMQRA